MNLIGKIKLLFKIRKPAEDLLQEVKTMKAGWKTTEFWLTLLSTLGTIAGALSGVLDPKTAAIISAVLTGLYTTLRSAVKAGSGDTSTMPPAPAQ